MYNRRTVYQLTRNEMNELKEYLLFLDEEEFYEEINEIFEVTGFVDILTIE